MLTSSLLPRPLQADSGNECPTLLACALTAVHFERKTARSLGWRGIRPGAAATSAWTFRLHNSEYIYGLRFDGEHYNTATNVIYGRFALFVFPIDPEHILFERLPLAAMHCATSDAYQTFVRDFVLHPANAESFFCGTLLLNVHTSGQWLELSWEAAARRRIIARDGLGLPNGQWIVEPGKAETDVPQFSLGLRFFSVLAATLRHQLVVEPAVATTYRTQPGCSYSTEGLFVEPDFPEHILTIRAQFGVPTHISTSEWHPMNTLPCASTLAESTLTSKPVLHVLTGFLGAGKTTFLKGWLDYLHARERYTGVLQNEFGAIDLDATLIGNETRVELLDEGCVCCSLADRLRPGIERILADFPVDHFVLETTGLANPHNVFEALNDLRDCVEPGLTITLVDCLQWVDMPDDAGMLDALQHAQISKADILVLNKLEFVQTATLQQTTRMLQRINPSALLLLAPKGHIAYAELDAFMDAHCATKVLPSHRPALSLHNKNTHAMQGYTSQLHIFEHAITPLQLEHMLLQAGPGLCRAKGLVYMDVAKESRLTLVQYAAGKLELDEMTEAYTAPPYLVMIGKNLNPVHTVRHEREQTCS